MRIFSVLFLLISTFTVVVRGADYPNAESIDSDRVISNLEGKKDKYLPHDKVLPNIDIQDDALKKRMDKAKEMLAQKSESEVRVVDSEETTKTKLIEEGEWVESETRPIPRPKKQKKQKQVYSAPPVMPAPAFKDVGGVRIFTSNLRFVQNAQMGQTVSLPSGATAMASVLAGIEVSATESRKTYAQMDYAFLGPNDTVVELKGCIVWFSVQANYTTERIYGETSHISCRAPNGKTFTVPIKGHLIDRKDQYIGAKGELLAHGKILAAALLFMRDATTEFGKALAAAQVSTKVVEGNANIPTQTAENVTGSRAAYVVGQSTQGAVGNFLNWWVDFYQGLSPTVAIGPGKKIFLAIEDEIQIPKIFFQGELTKDQLNQEQRRLNTIEGTPLAKEERE